MAQRVKRVSTMRDTWDRSLGWEDSLEKEMATHSSTLALKIPWTKELGAGYTIHGVTMSWARLSEYLSLTLRRLQTKLGANITYI